MRIHSAVVEVTIKVKVAFEQNVLEDDTIAAVQSAAKDVAKKLLAAGYRSATSHRRGIELVPEVKAVLELEFCEIHAGRTTIE